MEMLSTRDRWWMSQCDALLLAEGIEARWVPDGRAMTLDVPASHVETVSDGLSSLFAEDRQRRLDRVALNAVNPAPLWLQTPFVLGFGIAFLHLVFFVCTGGVDQASSWFVDGRLERASFLEGEWWRIVTASTLHADVRHVAGNAAFLWVLGWAAAERVGEGLAAFGWLSTALAGFLVSLGVTDVELTVGASGGLFGLLGLASASAYRTRELSTLHRRHRLRTLGSGVLLLAFTAFSPGSNIAAHVGGFGAGVLLAFTLPRWPLPLPAQWFAGAVTAGLLWMAWTLV